MSDLCGVDMHLPRNGHVNVVVMVVQTATAVIGLEFMYSSMPFCGQTNVGNSPPFSSFSASYTSTHMSSLFSAVFSVTADQHVLAPTQLTDL